MKKTSVFVFVGLCGAGLLFGVGARWLFMDPVESAVTEITDGTPTVVVRPTPVGFPRTRSADTLESLAALDGDGLYERLALWLIDASEPEIAAYWTACRQREIRPEITDLIFIQWTRLNPQGVLATGEPRAWWAWTCHDPQAALIAALAAGPDQVKAVACGLGQFHPAWLREHFHEIPEEAREMALSGLARWGDAENPLEMLEFAGEHGMRFNPSMFRALVSKDPWAAFDWAKENKSGMDPLIAQLAEERPDDLARLAAQSPSGGLKRRMEAALFANLVKTDLAAAIAEAKAVDVPRTAAERLAAVGLTLAKTDPGKAFEMAEDLFTACPNALSVMHSIQVPGGGSGGQGSAVNGVTDLMLVLLEDDPGRLLELVATKSDRGHSFGDLSEKWLERDVDAYAEWVNRQTDPALRDDAANELIGKLQEDHRYREAVDWQMSLTVSKGHHDLFSMLYRWGEENLPEALEWLEAANLPKEKKQTIRNNLAR